MKNSSLNFNFKSLLDWRGVLLIIFVLFLAITQCNQNNIGEGDIVKIDNVKYQIKKKSVDTVYKPVEIIEHRSKEQIYTFIHNYDTIPVDVDTAEILKDYFAKVVSIDTLQLKDSLGYVVVTDTVYKNRIDYRTYYGNINQKIIYDTTWLTPIPTPNLYFGITGGFTKNQLPNTIGVSMLYQTPKEKIYGLGVGLQNGNVVYPYINGSMYWKIKLKKDANKSE
jgi:translation initiation factor IF-1